MTDQLLLVVMLLLVGYLLLLLELLVIPGFGITGVAGFISLGVGAFLAVRYFGGARGGLAVTGVILSTTLLLVGVPRTRFGRGIVHRRSLRGATATTTSLTVGAEGIAESDLRPAGIARFGERRQSVVTDGEFLVAGSPLRVALVEGGRVVVETLEAAPGTDDDPASPAAAGPTGDPPSARLTGDPAADRPAGDPRKGDT